MILHNIWRRIVSDDLLNIYHSNCFLEKFTWAKDYHKIVWLLLAAVRINGARIEHHWHLCCHTYIVNIFSIITSHSGRLCFLFNHALATGHTRLMQGRRFLGFSTVSKSTLYNWQIQRQVNCDKPQPKCWLRLEVSQLTWNCLITEQ